MTGRPASSYVVTNETSAICGVNALKRIVVIHQLILHANSSEAFLLGPGSAGRVFAESNEAESNPGKGFQRFEASTCNRAVSTFVRNSREKVKLGRERRSHQLNFARRFGGSTS